MFSSCGSDGVHLHTPSRFDSSHSA
jgi:hypothetical protein